MPEFSHIRPPFICILPETHIPILTGMWKAATEATARMRCDAFSEDLSNSPNLDLICVARDKAPEPEAVEQLTRGVGP